MLLKNYNSSIRIESQEVHIILHQEGKVLKFFKKKN